MAIYKFLTDEDLDLGMSKYHRDTITAGSDKLHIMKKCESAAFSIIKTKLNNKFDLALLFPSIKAYDPEKDYVAGEYVYKGKCIYIALQDSTNVNPTDPAQSEYWEENDPRDHLLVKHAATITTYFMAQSTPPRTVSEDLADSYEAVMDWLDDVRDGHESPDWTLKESGGSSDIPWGSNEQLDHYPEI
jgi:hypothetical protein